MASQHTHKPGQQVNNSANIDSILEYPKINSMFIKDIKFLMNWNVDIISNDAKSDIEKKYVIDTCRLLC